MKFKVGDKVKIASQHVPKKIGTSGVVKKVTLIGAVEVYIIDFGPCAAAFEDFPYFVNDIELDLQASRHESIGNLLIVSKKTKR